jgi:hypothetical protein
MLIQKVGFYWSSLISFANYDDKDNTKYFVVPNIWTCKDQTSQNPHQHINYFAILVTYPYVVLF